MRILPGVCSCGFLCKAAVCVVSGLFMQSCSRGASRLFMQSRSSRGFRLFMQSCRSRASRFFMQSRRSRVSGLLLPVRMRFPASAVSRRVRLPSSPASRANAASGRARLCRNLTDTSFLSVPLLAHLFGDRSITTNPLSAVHFWYFPSISGRNREAFYQKIFLWHQCFGRYFGNNAIFS